MKDLLQELWDEYRLLITLIDDYCDDVGRDERSQELLDSISDNDKMKELRGRLNAAGVRNIPGIDVKK